MTEKTQPTAHAEITAPISADLRRLPALSEQDAGLLEQAASMLEGLHNDERNRGNCSAAEGAACSADAVRRLAVQLLRASQPAPAAVAVPIELQGVKDAVEQGSGFWRSCTGCHELNEGHATGPVSKVFGCALGNGCSECGGIGAVWDDIDYGAMADAMAAPAQEHATQLAGQAQDCGVCGSDEAFTGTCGGGRKNPRALCFEAAPAQAQEDAPIVWPKSRDVGRIGDMSMTASLRVGLDGDNDTYVNVWDENGGGSIEFCTPGAGGGKSRRTRVALLALMVAMEADNAEDPRRDWWAARAAQGGAA